jgi:phage terminase large subunit-like protein
MSRLPKGPKAPLSAPPLDLRRLPKAGGARCIAFIERYVTVPKGTGAKRRMKLRGWQKSIVRGVLDEPRPRQGLVAIPAGNGKSTLAAAIGLYGLLADGVEGAQVLVVASDERQARIIFNTARRMVELDKDLAARVQIFKDHLLEPKTDSVFMALPADPGALQGWDPSMALVDELHVVTDDTYEAMAARAGKRDRSLLLAISTPPKQGQDDSVMRRLVDHGRDGGDPSFFFREFAAPPGCALDDEAAWEVANPALDDFLHRDALRATLPPKMRENAFRRYRLGQWVAQDDAWLPDGAWAACTDAARVVPDQTEVVAAFDGSFNRDCSVLVLATVEPRPHVWLERIWEAPEGRRDWRVPVVAVEDAIRAACARWRVAEVAADPYRWQRSLEVLDGDGVPVHEFFQTAARMGPATARMYQLIVDQGLTHDGDTALARHVANAILREDSRGARLSKETKDSPRRIDAAVAAVMAVHRAAELAGDRALSIYI